MGYDVEGSSTTGIRSTLPVCLHKKSGCTMDGRISQCWLERSPGLPSAVQLVYYPSTVGYAALSACKSLTCSFHSCVMVSRRCCTERPSQSM